MKVLLIDTTKAFLTPGGKTTHALKLQQEISKLGVDIEFARWWDSAQSDADIIHFLSGDTYSARLAKQKGMKTFFSMIFDFETNKSSWEKAIAKIKIKIKYLFLENFYWKSLKFMDCVQFMHIYDMNCAKQYFPSLFANQKVVVIPHAYDPLDINISDCLNIENMHFPTKYLVSCANISPRKQTLKLAKLAKKACTPIVFIGGHSDDDYFASFRKEIDNKYVFYPGYVSKEWKDCIEKNAAGFVLLSLGESGCIAVYEAAAYKIPLLLSNLPWAWGYEKPTDIFFCDQQNEKKATLQLKHFYERACKLDHPPFLIRTWSEVALNYVNCYKELLTQNNDKAENK